MSIQLEIPDTLFVRIKQNAIPFVDLTPVSVLERWADHFEKQQSQEGVRPSAPSAEPSGPVGKKFSPLNPPDLMHTRCQGTFGSMSFRKWNDLVRVAHAQAFKQTKSFEALLSVTHAQIRKGDHSGDSGYHYVPEIDISIQGVDANHAWLYSLRLAQYLKVPLIARIEWRYNEKAAFAGEMGVIEWRP
jgi:hypothetical protein